MANGIPIIASRKGSLIEVVEDGTSGLLFEPGDVNDLTVKIKKLWHNRELTRKMGRSARKKAKNEYDENIFMKNIINAFEAAIQQSKRWN
jgi:glycosyltransferase involved in cell wall biosynthesis